MGCLRGSFLVLEKDSRCVRCLSIFLNVFLVFLVGMPTSLKLAKSSCILANLVPPRLAGTTTTTTTNSEGSIAGGATAYLYIFLFLVFFKAHEMGAGWQSG